MAEWLPASSMVKIQVQALLFIVMYYIGVVHYVLSVVLLSLFHISSGQFRS